MSKGIKIAIYIAGLVGAGFVIYLVSRKKSNKGTELIDTVDEPTDPNDVNKPAPIIYYKTISKKPEGSIAGYIAVKEYPNPSSRILHQSKFGSFIGYIKKTDYDSAQETDYVSISVHPSVLSAAIKGNRVGSYRVGYVKKNEIQAIEQVNNLPLL